MSKLCVHLAKSQTEVDLGRSPVLSLSMSKAQTAIALTRKPSVSIELSKVCCSNG